MDLRQQLSEIEGFQWDFGNAVKSMVKHGVSVTESEQVFKNKPLMITDDENHSFSEHRGHALGKTDVGQLLHVSFTIRENRIRIISARPMSRLERKIYEKN